MGSIASAIKNVIIKAVLAIDTSDDHGQTYAMLPLY